MIVYMYNYTCMHIMQERQTRQNSRGVAEVAKIDATICHNLGQFLKGLLFSISKQSD